MKLSSRLISLREKKHKTIKQISSEIGVSFQHLGNIENDNSLPSLELLQRIANYYHVSLSSLLFGVTIDLDKLSEMEHRKIRHRNRYTLRRIFHTDKTDEERKLINE